MILGFRFLSGVAVGAILGIMVSADDAARVGLNLQEIKTAIWENTWPPQSEADKVIWPSDEAAKQELFRWSKWDYDNSASQSAVRVERCITLDPKTISCEMTATLSWVRGSSFIEATFERTADGWYMIRARSRNLPSH